VTVDALQSLTVGVLAPSGHEVAVQLRQDTLRVAVEVIDLAA
jgi:hypothetical protein